MKNVYYYYTPREEEKKKSLLGRLLVGILFTAVFLLFAMGEFSPLSSLSPFSGNSLNSLSEDEVKNGHEIFGFAPYWTLDKLENVDFNVLTTLAYFGIEVNPDGTMAEDSGYTAFHSDKATRLFQEAHDHGTRVVLTITQMKNDRIKSFLDNSDAQERIIDDTVEAVSRRGIDGINVDFEYSGDPGADYRNKFSIFVRNLSERMHEELPDSRVTVSVYASAGKDSKLYDLASLSDSTDGIFMMAYDFATAGSDTVIPTAPLYGHKEGKYWYDIATAVEDFLEVMPKEKLILGLPWYGYNYPVEEPGVKVSKDYGYYDYYWKWGYKYSYFVPRQAAHAQTYSLAKNNITVEKTGWDDYGKVGWKAYKDASGQWRMIFLDDVRSLSVKYDFVKEKDLGGVGIWALGFDDGKQELWNLLNEKFGTKLVDTRIKNRQIYGI